MASTSKREKSSEYDKRFGEIRLELLEESLKFVKWDNSLNNEISKMVATIANHVKSNPSLLTSGNADLEKILQTIKNTEGDIGGISGGGPLDDLNQLLDILLGPLKGEKDFFLKLIEIVKPF